MGFGPFFLGFFQPVAVGAGMVLALLLIIWITLPRRSAIAVNRRTNR